MSGKVWVEGAGGTEHPDKSVLLAYTRQQLPQSEEPDILQHIVQCQQCNEQCKMYVQTSTLLTQGLAYTPLYPSLVASIVEGIHRPETIQLARQKREQERRRSVLAVGARGISLFSLRMVPLLVLAAMIVLVAVIALANQAQQPVPPARNQNHLITGTQIILTGVVPHSTPIPTLPVPVQNITPYPEIPAVTPTVTVNTRQNITNPSPIISVCTSTNDMAHNQLRICGSNFTSGDKIELYSIGYQGLSRSPFLIVDTSGNISGVLPINGCNTVPIYIYAINLTHHTNNVTLHNIRFGNCSLHPLPGRK